MHVTCRTYRMHCTGLLVTMIVVFVLFLATTPEFSDNVSTPQVLCQGCSVHFLGTACCGETGLSQLHVSRAHQAGETCRCNTCINGHGRVIARQSMT